MAVALQPVGGASHRGAVEDEAQLVVARRVLLVAEKQIVLDEHDFVGLAEVVVERGVVGEELVREDERGEGHEG